jgi:hypothetical protein
MTMDLVTLPFRLPFLPVQGLIRIAELIQEEAERQYHDPAAARRRLEEAAEAYDRGDISSEELYDAQVEALEPVVRPAPAPGAAGTDARGEEE